MDSEVPKKIKSSCDCYFFVTKIFGENMEGRNRETYEKLALLPKK